MKVALDAGHGAGTGACGGGFVEDRLNLEMVIRIGHYLRLSGVATCLTRNKDELIPISARASIAMREKCDVLISIHFNAGPSEARGAECFVVAGDERSTTLAGRIMHQLCLLDLPMRGVKADNQGAHSRLGILRGVYKHMSAVLVEPAFLTNAQDAELLRDRLFRDRLAKAIAAGILALQVM
jgi:N-acetylmuramoyl-L-alanine amidase